MTPITQLEGILTTLVQLCTMLMEFFGVSILVSTAIKCFLRWLKKDQEIRLTLASRWNSILAARCCVQLSYAYGLVWDTWRHYCFAWSIDILDPLGNKK